MSVLKSLENKIAGLVEGTFSRAFRSEVRPVEIARKLAREMEEHKSFSVSRTYAPNEYRVFLSPRDRERFAGYEIGADSGAGGIPARARTSRAPHAPLTPGDRVRDRRPARTRRVRHPDAGRPARRRAGERPGREARPRSRAGLWSTATPSAIPEPLRDGARPARARAQTALLLIDGRRVVIGAPASRSGAAARRRRA